MRRVLSLCIVLSACSSASPHPPLARRAEDVRQVGLAPGQLVFEGGEIRCAAGPNGYWVTPRAYRNFRLTLEYRFTRPPDLIDEQAFGGNSGYLLYVTGPDHVFPKSIEVQGENRDVARIFGIAGAEAVTEPFDDPAARRESRRPVGEWNVVDIDSKEGRVTSYLNGVRISSAQSNMREGPIAFQCEGAEIAWRRVSLVETE